MDSVVISRLPDRIVSVAIRQNLQQAAARAAAGLMINVELPALLATPRPGTLEYQACGRTSNARSEDRELAVGDAHRRIGPPQKHDDDT